MADECKINDQAKCPHLEEAADKAVRKVFAILGVDIGDPQQVSEFQQDLRFGRTMRRATDRGIMAVVGLMAIGLAAAVWAGIVTNIRGH